MSMATDVFENGLLSLIFQNANYANVGDATGLRGSTTAGVFYISLHTADPGETGSQNTSEAAYTNYLRSGGSVARSAAGWTVAAGNADNTAAIIYAACGSTGATVTHFGVGSDSTGSGNLFIHGDVNPDLVVSSGVTPSFGIGQLDIALA
jgi:hypothetical protein